MKADTPDNRDSVTIPFGQKYAESEQFKIVFREGMALVEETAAYLDGDGRREAKALAPPTSLAYATESMRLTTRLMQLASWLLIRRAVNEGELTPQQAIDEGHKVKLKPVGNPARAVGYSELPERLRVLIESSHRMHERIIKLDALIRTEQAEQTPAGANPLGAQMARLKATFNAVDAEDAKDEG
ncbi:MAG: DUF1465 family protein [Methyloligellaceae bacterium]